MTGDERVVIRPSYFRLRVGFAALAATVAATDPRPLGRAMFAAYAVLSALSAVPRVVLRPDHLEVRSARRRRRVPWSEVRVVRAAPLDDAATAVLADGTRVALPMLRWEPLERTDAPFSARDLVAYARGHGYDVEFDSTPEGDAGVPHR